MVHGREMPVVLWIMLLLSSGAFEHGMIEAADQKNSKVDPPMGPIPLSKFRQVLNTSC